MYPSHRYEVVNVQVKGIWKKALHLMSKKQWGDRSFSKIFLIFLKLGSINLREFPISYNPHSSLFDMGLFQSDRVLTSRPIQRQFQKAVKERAKKNTILIECFWLLDENETEPFLKISRTISLNYPDCSGENPKLFPEKSTIIPEKTSDYSKKNFSFSMKKASYSGKNSSFSDKKQDYSREETLNDNKIYNNIAKRAITREEKQELIQEFGAEITEEYIRRTSEYHCCNPVTIRKWITEDQKKHKRNENAFATFPQRNYEQNVMNALERHLLRDDRKEAKEEIIQLPISSSLI